MGKSSKNDGVKKVIDAIKSIQKEKKKTLKTNMRSVRQYLYKTIRNSFKRTPKKRRNGPPLYVFDEDGKRLCMVQSLLNNSFRAFGHGSYQKEKVQTSYKGFNIPGTYAYKNQKPGEFFKKGTGKFSDEERDAIEYRRKPGATIRKIVREIRKKQADLNRIEGLQSWSEEDKTSSKSIKKEIKDLKKRRKKLESGSAPKPYRIVAKNKHDVPARDVQSHVQIVPHSKPGEAPFTNPEFKSPLRKLIYYKDFPEGFQLYAVSRDGDKVFTALEFGGSAYVGAKKGVFIGYTLVHTYEKSSGTHHKFSHKRVSLRRRFSGKKEQIRFEPRPFFEPAKKRAVEKIQDIFGAEAAQYADKVRFF